MPTRRDLLKGAAAVAVGTGALIAVGTSPAMAKKATTPLVIGHRGASGYRPEHTLAAYQMAIDLGADYIEPDLVVTRDGVLVARHENEIGGTTDVADFPQFADRRTTKTIDGTRVSGWFTEDFTIGELKTLRAKERIPALRPGNMSYDGQFSIPTLQEVIDLAKENERKLASQGVKKTIGIYPETKHPTYFAAIGLPFEERLVLDLEKNGYTSKSSAVFIQSFETGNLKRLAKMTKVPLVQLIDASGRPYDLAAANDPRTYADLVRPAGLTEIAGYAQGVGANKTLIVPRDAANNDLTPTTLLKDAHARGLIVHGWTFRLENNFLSNQRRYGDSASATYLRQAGDLRGEIRQFLDLGMDGFFSDNPDEGVIARDVWVNEV